MKVYTYSRARQKLATLLDEAKKDGEVRIRRRDGKTYVVKPLEDSKSPLDVEGVDSELSLEDLNNAVRESRSHYTG